MGNDPVANDGYSFNLTCDLVKHLRHTSVGHSQASLPSKDDRVMAKACRAHMGKL